MDYWQYPVGTQFFKEFTVDGRRVETRLLQKSTKGWTAIAYVWNEDATEAVAAPNGQRAALGTEHDVPKQSDCKTCHDKMQDFVLGFTALQLAHDGSGVTLDSLVGDARLSDPPAAPLVIPGNDTTRAALGYLHANCGTCHNDRSFVMARTPISLWLTVDSLASLEGTAPYQTAVGKRTGLDGEHELLIAAGAPEQSEIVARMLQRGTEEQMPPIASKKIDPDGVALVESWIADIWEEQ
jgi:cytochrome c556